MKLTKSSLIHLGLDHLIAGTSLKVPVFLSKKVALLFDDDTHIIAFMACRYLNDFRIYRRVMIVLNQLVNYYQKPVVLYCVSYRSFITQEKVYQVFKKHPKLM